MDNAPSAYDHGERGMQRTSAAAALPSLVAGLLIGACLALTAACGILLSARRVLPGMAATSTPLVSKRIARATSTPMSAAATMLLEAEALLRDGDPQASIALLSPWLTELIREDRVRAYDLMGQAELELGHPGLAGACFDRAYRLVPTVERLYEAALGYDLGGDEERALARYLELLAWEGKDGDPYRDFALARIHHIRVVLGTPSPQ